MNAYVLLPLALCYCHDQEEKGKIFIDGKGAASLSETLGANNADKPLMGDSNAPGTDARAGNNDEAPLVASSILETETVGGSSAVSKLVSSNAHQIETVAAISAGTLSVGANGAGTVPVAATPVQTAGDQSRDSLHITDAASHITTDTDTGNELKEICRKESMDKEIIKPSDKEEHKKHYKVSITPFIVNLVAL